MGFRGIPEAVDAREIVLRRFDGDFVQPAYATAEWFREHQGAIRTGVVLDVETTGLDPRSDRVIEIAMRAFEFDKTSGDVVSVGERYASLNDPGMPIPEVAKRVTGLTDSDVHGKRIDLARVGALLDWAHVVIAHNASFDRPFVDGLFATSAGVRKKKTHWACTLTQIDWDSKSMPSAKLEVLCVFHGFYCATHRAGPDADALLHLLGMRDVDTGRAYLDGLLRVARERVGRLSAKDAPMESKDALKARRYRWDPERRVWHRIVRTKDHDEEVAWLSKAVYRGPSRAVFEEIAPEDRFALGRE